MNQRKLFLQTLDKPVIAKLPIDFLLDEAEDIYFSLIDMSGECDFTFPEFVDFLKINMPDKTYDTINILANHIKYKFFITS